MTLRLMSPQAAMELSRTVSIAFSVAFRFDLMTPCSCTVCRVVSRMVPLP